MDRVKNKAEGGKEDTLELAKKVRENRIQLNTSLDVSVVFMINEVTFKNVDSFDFLNKIQQRGAFPSWLSHKIIICLALVQTVCFNIKILTALSIKNFVYKILFYLYFRLTNYKRKLKTRRVK